MRVPATSANLGPGYDCLGLALALHDEVTATVVDTGLLIGASGEGADTLPADESHLIVRAMRATFDLLGADCPGLELHGHNSIPHGRGLGSSAAAICAGVLLARALVADGAALLDDAGVLALATLLEGHPDNVAACLLGALTIAWTDAEGGHAVRVATAAGLEPVVFIPATESSTAHTRSLLPAHVPHGDAAFNAARTALLVAAMTVAPDQLLTATEDRLHQPYRAAAMPDTAALMQRLRAEGIPAVVSGAGPTVLALARSADEARRAAAHRPDGWRLLELGVEATGATVLARVRE